MAFDGWLLVNILWTLFSLMMREAAVSAVQCFIALRGLGGLTYLPIDTIHCFVTLIVTVIVTSVCKIVWSAMDIH